MFARLHQPYTDTKNNLCGFAHRFAASSFQTQTIQEQLCCAASRDCASFLRGSPAAPIRASLIDHAGRFMSKSAQPIYPATNILCSRRDEVWRTRRMIPTMGHSPSSAFSALFTALSAFDQNGSSFQGVTAVTERRRREPCNEEADRYRVWYYAR